MTHAEYQCDACGAVKWLNAVTNKEICPVCDLGFPPKKVVGYEQLAQDVLIEERMCEARDNERERCAKICDDWAETHQRCIDRGKKVNRKLISIWEAQRDQCRALAEEIREEEE